MDRKEFVNEVFRQLEENHIFLYHDISKEEFEKQKNKFLKTVDKLDELHFQGGMLKLFALFKDAHVNYESGCLNMVFGDFYQIENKFYLRDGTKYKEITKINGKDVGEVARKLKSLIPYEVDTWANRRVRDLIASPNALIMVDCGKDSDKITYNCGDEKFVLRTLTKEELQNLSKNKPREKLYDYKTFDSGDILYVKYAACRDMKDYPFADFVRDMTKNLSKKPKTCIVDVRFNMGGNDEIILPLIEFLKKSKIKTYGLMNNATFSSGTFALAYLKRDLNATLVGVEAGQPTFAFGNMRYLNVQDKRFSYCNRYFELSSCPNPSEKVEPYCRLNAFDYSGVIKPDVKIEMKIEDLNKGVDTQLDGCLDIARKEIEKSCGKGKE